MRFKACAVSVLASLKKLGSKHAKKREAKGKKEGFSSVDTCDTEIRCKMTSLLIPTFLVLDNKPRSPVNRSVEDGVIRNVFGQISTTCEEVRCPAGNLWEVVSFPSHP